MKFTLKLTVLVDFMLIAYSSHLAFYKSSEATTIPNLLGIIIILIVVSNWNTERIK